MTRSEWCRDLALLVSPSFPLEAQKALMNMLPAMQHLPDNLFTPQSLLKVAQAKRRQSVPAWDELIDAIHEYRQSLNPHPWINRSDRCRSISDLRQYDDREFPPGPAEIEAVTQKLAAFRKEQAEARIAREMAKPKGADSKPLRDVTAKGEALRQMRLARGCNIPVPGLDDNA